MEITSRNPDQSKILFSDLCAGDVFLDDNDEWWIRTDDMYLATAVCLHCGTATDLSDNGDWAIVRIAKSATIS